MARSEREAGLRGYLPCLVCGGIDTRAHTAERGDEAACRRNGHPTVKLISLLRYLCRLTKTPTGGTVFDPFLGSGSTLCAAALEGRDGIGIEREAEYCDIARQRIAHWSQQTTLPMRQAVSA